MNARIERLIIRTFSDIQTVFVVVLATTIFLPVALWLAIIEICVIVKYQYREIHERSVRRSSINRARENIGG